MRMELWGGPHDGLAVMIDGTPTEWHEAVPLTASEAHALQQQPAGTVPAVRVAKYRLHPQRLRYEYAGQIWL